MDIQNKIITIIGAQRSGMAVARLAHHLGGLVKVSDSGLRDNVDPSFDAWMKEHEHLSEWGAHTRTFIEDSDYVVLSPGVPYDAEVVQWAKAKNIRVVGEVEFAYQLCDIPIIVVTGSNGKTTVVTLIDQVLKQGGYRSLLCGNIGRPFSEYALSLDKYDYVVIEMSSFQLEMINGAKTQTDSGWKYFKPHIAVFLNCSQNHLDRHASFEDYFAAKTRMFLHQDQSDYALLNDNDPKMCAMAQQLKAQVQYFGDCDQQADIPQLILDNPNYRAVTKVADTLQIPIEICLKVFHDFKGVEHRMEWVRCLDGVDYINDAKSTTSESGRWALNHIDKSIILICGGKDKNMDFSVLMDVVQQRVKKMHLFGEAKGKMKTVFESVVDVVMFSTLQEAVEQARVVAQEGDCVVLSPMCASFDMFTNFEERGRVFKDIVYNLK